MVKCNLRIFLFGIIFVSGESFAQTYLSPSDSVRTARELYDPSQISNEIFLRTSEDAFGDQLQFISDDIERLASEPIILGTTSWQDLQQIPTLTDLDIYHILKNSKEGSPLTSDIQSSERLFVKKTLGTSHQHVSLHTRVVLDPDAAAQSVYQNDTYHGSPVKTVSRLLAKNDDILFSLVEAKDPGEPLYFDHLTGCFALTHSISVTDDIALSKLVLGDYSLSFGSGLLFSSGYGQLSSRRVTLNPAPRSAGIQPYISSSSYKFFRGAAAELSSGMLSASGFFSDRKIDASFDSSGREIVAFPSTGYHRTALELSRKDQAESRIAGGHIALTPLSEDNFLQIGATAYSLEYNKPVAVKDSLSPGFSGQKHSMISFDFRSAFSIVSFAGEYAKMISDAGNANAFAMTLLAAPLEILEISLNYHDLPVNFISPFGSTFGINAAGVQNETGFYLGSRLSVIRNAFWLFGSMNISQSQNPVGSALHYSDIILGSEYSSKSIPLSLAFQLRSYGKSPAFSISGDSLSKNSFRFDANADLTRTISVSLRLELQRSYSIADSIAKSGHLIGIGMYYLPLPELSVSSGIAFFATDSYASRLYSNEADLPGSVPFVALYGIGYRYYLQLSYDMVSSLTLSARVAESRYSPSAGSTPLHKTTVGAQCDIAF